MKRIIWLAVLFSFPVGECFAQTLANSQETSALNFNQYYNGSNIVTKVTGYSGMLYTDPTTGVFAIETGGTNNAGSTVTRSGLLYVTPGGYLGLTTSTPRASVDLGFKTDALILQSGTTGQRPAAVEGMIRYNSTSQKVEAYQGGAWVDFGGTATGGGTTYLGTAANNTAPSRSDDVTTGLFSDTGTSVSVSIAGTERVRTTPTETTFTGDVKLSAITNAYYLAGNKILHQPASDTTSLGIGLSSLASQTGTNLYNTAVGYQALLATTTQANNTAVGYQALVNSRSDHNTAVGRLALNAQTTGGNNTAVGSTALYWCSTGSNNTAVGVVALQWVRGGQLNTAVGSYAQQNTMGSYNTSIGYGSLSNNTTGSGNTALGYYALSSATPNNLTGNYNSGIGYQSLYGIQTTAAMNTAVGYKSGYTITTGESNVIMGPAVGSTTLTTGSNNILIGTSSLVDTPAANTSNYLNIGRAIKLNLTNVTATSAWLHSPALDNTSVGVGLGSLAAQTATSSENTAIGHQTLLKTTTGITNTAVGAYALYNNISGSWNTAVGSNALYKSTDNSNSAFGMNALYNTTGWNNTAVGSSAGYSVTTGYRNTIVGDSVGKTTLTTGYNNILIGTSSAVDVPTSSTNNYLNIGNTIAGNMSTPTLSSCGTGASITGSDIIGKVTIGTGSSSCTITFASAKTAAPACIVTGRSGNVPVYTTSSTALTLTTATASQTYDYFCGK